MRVEQAVGSLKRFRAIADVFRHQLGEFDDLFAERGAGFWNFHLGVLNRTRPAAGTVVSLL